MIKSIYVFLLFLKISKKIHTYILKIIIYFTLLLKIISKK